jgi:hypothetical protein
MEEGNVVIKPDVVEDVSEKTEADKMIEDANKKPLLSTATIIILAIIVIVLIIAWAMYTGKIPVIGNFNMTGK